MKPEQALDVQDSSDARTEELRRGKFDPCFGTNSPGELGAPKWYFWMRINAWCTGEEQLHRKSCSEDR